MSIAEYTFIESIEDLKENLTMDMMNQKFIDREGIRYVVRFNVAARRLEINRLQLKAEIEKTEPINTTLSAIQQGQAKNANLINRVDELEKSIREGTNKPKAIIKNPNYTPQVTQDYDETVEVQAVSFDIDDFDLNIEERKKSNPKIQNLKPKNEFDFSLSNDKLFIQDCINDIDKAGERLRAVITNLKNSKVLEINQEQDEKFIMLNLQRDFDMKVFDKMNQLNSLFNEFTSYPKPHSYYINSIDKKAKNFITSLAEDSQKLIYIIRFTMQDKLMDFVLECNKLLYDTLKYLNTKNTFNFKLISAAQRDMFNNSKDAILFIIKDLSKLEKRIDLWRESNPVLK